MLLLQWSVLVPCLSCLTVGLCKLLLQWSIFLVTYLRLTSTVVCLVVYLCLTVGLLDAAATATCLLPFVAKFGLLDAAATVTSLGGFFVPDCWSIGCYFYSDLFGPVRWPIGCCCYSGLSLGGLFVCLTGCLSDGQTSCIIHSTMCIRVRI
jgi:hypothetical protein